MRIIATDTEILLNPLTDASTEPAVTFEIEGKDSAPSTAPETGSPLDKENLQDLVAQAAEENAGVAAEDETPELKDEQLANPAGPAELPEGGDGEAVVPLEPVEVLPGTEAKDELTGGEEGEIIFGEGGRDTLSGAGGDDTMLGGDGRDEIDGGSGDDVIDGGAGRDVMAGGEGSDTFVFEEDSGRDTIADFQAGDAAGAAEGTEEATETDVLDFSKADGVSSIEDLEIEQVGEDTVITFGDSELTLTGVDAADLAESNFQFAEPEQPILFE